MSLRTRLELKTSGKIVEAMRQIDPGMNCAVAPAPCHIIREEHAGIVYPFGAGYMLAYRCQGKWWGREIREELAIALQGAGFNPALTEVATSNTSKPHLLLASLGGITDSAATFVYSRGVRG